MKKLLGSLSTGLLYLYVAAPAFAEINVDPCDPAIQDGGQSGAVQQQLCNLQAGDLGGVIRAAIVILLVAAALIALFFLIWGGIRWILSGGDKGKVDAARSTIVAAIVGLIIAFLAYFLLSVILDIFGLGLGNLGLPDLSAQTGS